MESVKIASTVECVNVGHHGIGSVDSSPGVSKKFLCPSAKLVAWASVGGNLLDGVAVTDPVKVTAPEVRVNDGESPSSSGDFTDEGMVVGFGGGATAGGGMDGL